MLVGIHRLNVVERVGSTICDGAYVSDIIPPTVRCTGPGPAVGALPFVTEAEVLRVADFLECAGLRCCGVAWEVGRVTELVIGHPSAIG
jgi:hypothetical protein